MENEERLKGFIRESFEPFFNTLVDRIYYMYAGLFKNLQGEELDKMSGEVKSLLDSMAQAQINGLKSVDLNEIIKGVRKKNEHESEK